MRSAMDALAGVLGMQRCGFEARVPQLVPRYTLNSRGHWSKGYRENKKAKAAVALVLCRQERPALPVTVTLTRCAPRPLDDDNSVSSLKGVRDAVAKWLDVDDRDSRVTWKYAQRKCKRADQGVVIRIEERT